MEDDCKHGLAIGTCSLCKPKPPITLSEFPEFAIPAKYNGRCPACEHSIYIGDYIVEDDGQWIHEECA